MRKSKYFMEVKKNELISILTILILSESDKILKGDLISKIKTSEEWLDESIKLLLGKLYLNRVNVDDNSVGRSLKFLKKENFVDRELSNEDRNRPGSQPQLWWLISENETLYKIFNLVNLTRLPEWVKDGIKYELFRSEFFKKLVNKDLAYELNELSINVDFMNSIEDKIRNEDLKLILDIIKISPSALDFVLNIIYNIKNNFQLPFDKFIINGVIYNLLNDLRKGSMLQEDIDYKIEIYFKENTIQNKERIKRETYTNYSDGKISLEVISSIETMKDN